jgi:hypothetical protein
VIGEIPFSHHVVAKALGAGIERLHYSIRGVCRCAMLRLRHYVGPSWPPHISAYDYTLTLCPSDLDWEFLRRNPGYQRDYRLSRRGSQPTRRLKCGLQLTRVRRHTSRSIPWGLHPFCRSGFAGTASTCLLVDQRRYPDTRGRLRARKGRLCSRPLHRSVPRCWARRHRADRRGTSPSQRRRQGPDTTVAGLQSILGTRARHVFRPRNSRPAQSGGRFS